MRVITASNIAWQWPAALSRAIANAKRNALPANNGVITWNNANPFNRCAYNAACVNSRFLRANYKRTVNQ